MVNILQRKYSIPSFVTSKTQVTKEREAKQNRIKATETKPCIPYRIWAEKTTEENSYKS